MARYTHFFSVVLGLLMLPIALLDASDIEDRVGQRGNGWEDTVNKLNDSKAANNKNWEDDKQKQEEIIKNIGDT